MRFLNSTLIKLTIYLIIGILLGHYFEIDYRPILWVNCSFIILLGSYLFFIRNSYKRPIQLGVLTFIMFLSLGVLTMTFHKQSNFKNHYTKLNISEGQEVSIMFRVREVLKPGNYYNKYVIDLIQINDAIVVGKTLLNIEKDSLLSKLHVDEVYTTITAFKTLIPPLNPHQFDYRSYLKKQHIYNQLFITQNALLQIKSKHITLFGYASKLRLKINSKLQKFDFKTDELAIINALLLGQRQDISETIFNSYTQAGAIHILAVSGLHVGILLILLNLLLKPLTYLKHGKLIKTLIIIILLWSFAIIAGLSASVVRAVCMFSIVAIGMHWHRPTNIYNTLIVSLFILLLFKPTFILDVGFQLSYLAVFAIVIIQPMVYNIWNPKNRVINFLWNIFTVTLATQFGVIPISLYYFHQFPGLFFISNLVIIPFLGILLGLGVLIILLALINLLPEFIASIYGTTIHFMNSFVQWISSQEDFIFKNIAFDIKSVLISYLLITLFIYTLKKKTYKSIIILLITIIATQGVFITNKRFPKISKFIVFHKSRYSMIGIQKQNNFMFHHNLSDSVFERDRTITNYVVGEHLKTVKTNESLKSIYQFNNKTLLVIDSLGIYNAKTFKPDIILLQNSPKINLERIIDSLNPELIISDGSNFKTYRDRWAKTCKSKKRPYYETSKKGAWVYEF